MSIFVSFNLSQAKDAAAAFEAFLRDAQAAEKKALSARDEAQQALNAAIAKVQTYAELLKKVNEQLKEDAGRGEDETEGDASTAIRKNRLGIDAKTREILRESGSAKTSDEIFALVASYYQSAYQIKISDKSVKNALGDAVKNKQLYKVYHKDKQAYLYGFPEFFSLNINGERESDADSADSQPSKENDVRPTPFLMDFKQKTAPASTGAESNWGG